MSVKTRGLTTSAPHTTQDTSAPLVVHIIHRLAMGGMENGLVNLINSTPPGRYRHEIISMTDSTDFRQRIRVPDVRVHELHKKPGKDPGSYINLWKCLKSIKPDIVHTRNMSAIEGQASAFMAGVRRRVHGEHGWDVADLHGKNRKYIWMRRILSLFIQRWVSLSLHGKAYLEQRIGINSRSIHHICNGVDTKRFQPVEKPISILPKGFLPQDGIVFGTVGRLEIVKDQMNLVRAFIHLLKTYPQYKDQARLVIVGDGSQRDLLLQTVEDAGIQESVWFAGARNDTPQVYSSLDIFILPSIAEGIPNTILEAMASGLPVIATKVGGNTDLVADGDTGYLVPASNPEAMAKAMVRYLEYPELVTQQNQAARKRALDGRKVLKSLR